MTDLLSLAERCEQAPKEDERLSFDIWDAVGRPAEWTVRDLKLDPPDYTESLDAAMTLVPEGASFALLADTQVTGGEGSTAAVNGHSASAATPALALCAAALRARAA